MKKIIGILVLVAVLMLGGYYVMGGISERLIKKDLALWKKSSDVSINIVQYKRGFFKSQALLHWKFHLPQQIVKSATGQSTTYKAENYENNMPLTIYHGPIIFFHKHLKFGLGYAHANLTLPSNYATQLNGVLTKESIIPSLDLSCFVNYFSKSKLEFTMPAVKLITKQGHNVLDFSSMFVSTQISSSIDKMDGVFKINDLHFTKDLLNASIKSINTNYALHKADAGLLVGDLHIALPSVSIMDNGKEFFTLNKFVLDTNSNITNGLVGTRLKIFVDNMQIDNKQYGPGDLETIIRNIDAATLADINQQASQLQQESGLAHQKALLILLTQLPKLFSKGAEFEIKAINFIMPAGKIQGDLIISLLKNKNNTTSKLLDKIQAKGTLQVPSVVVKQTFAELIKQKMMSPQDTENQTPTTNKLATATEPTQGSNSQAIATTNAQAALTSNDVTQQSLTLANNQLASMVKSGLLMVKGGDYSIEISFNHSELMINGKPFNTEMLKY